MSTKDGSVLGTTQVVDNGPSSVRFDLVIMGDGYQSAQLAQFATDAQAFVTKLFATAPFDDPAVAAAINVHRVDVSSTDSGADDPKACTGGTGATKRTYFDASFCRDGQIQRLLGVNEMTALSVAGAQVPSWNMVMVIVNSTIYGGSGGSVATFSLAPAANEIGMHEMGHTAFALADEYESYAGCGVDTDRNQHPRSEPAQQNVTIDPRATNKWGDLIVNTTALPTTSNPDCTRCDPQANPVGADTIGAFEGAHYYHCGGYRPQFNCRMRVLGQPFCAVCQRQIRRGLAHYNTQADLAVAAFGEADGWRVDHHPRFAFYRADLGRVEIVGFADDGVWVSRRQPDGSFTASEHMLAAFGFEAGGWRVDRHPRFVADITGDGRADIVGFADDGVWVSHEQLDGSFTGPEHVLAAFGFEAGGWRVDRHPRFLADTTGDGRADIVGFADDGVWISRAQPDGSYAQAEHVVAGFGFAAEAGGWQVDRHPRLMADTTGDGRADIVGFGNDGVWIARAQPDGSFTAQAVFVPGFGYADGAGGWRVERHPRMMADTSGDRRADIVGFGSEGVVVSRAQPDGSFSEPQLVVRNFGSSAGGWQVDRHPRFMADTTGDGRADIVGFGYDGVWVSRAKPDGSFTAPELVVANFGYDAGWRVEQHPRLIAEFNPGRAIGFRGAGVLVPRAQQR
jgi:IgA Peptidase M64/FG-GAP-like repeat